MKYEYISIQNSGWPNMERINELAKEGWRVVSSVGGGDGWTAVIMERVIGSKR
jgi:hypothetical protein